MGAGLVGIEREREREREIERETDRETERSVDEMHLGYVVCLGLFHTVAINVSIC